MKKSELQALVKEELTYILNENELSKVHSAKKKYKGEIVRVIKKFKLELDKAYGSDAWDGAKLIALEDMLESAIDAELPAELPSSSVSVRPN